MKGLFKEAESMKLPKHVKLCEVGLRDGLQNEKIQLTTEQKIKIVTLLTEAGYPVIEVGSFVSPKAVPQMADTDDVFNALNTLGATEYRALIVNERGLDRAIACGCKKVKLNVSASRAHNLVNLNCTPEQSVERFESIVRKANEMSIKTSGSISMPFGSPWEHEIPIDDVKKIIEAYLNTGIRELSLSDASGMAHPDQVYEVCSVMVQEYPEVDWILHFHNTRGMALSNLLAGMQAGVTAYDVAFAGLGGCPFVPGAAGNMSAEDTLHMLDEMGVETGVNLEKVIKVGKMVREFIGNSNSYILKAGPSKELIKEMPMGQGKNRTMK